MNASSGRRKHQVKVRSIVGVHESLLAILEDSNTIVLCGNSTSGDNFPPPPTTLERDEKSISQGSKRYTFDACFPVKGNEAELDKRKNSSLKVNIDSCVSLLLAGFNSTLLLSDMFAFQSSDLGAFSDIGVAEKILETMYTYNSFSVPPNFDADDVDTTMKLQICCYEVFDSAIVDLIPSSFASNAKGSVTKKPRVNQHMNAVDGSTIVDVDGVASLDVSICPGDSPESVVSLIRSAISQRLVLVKSSLTPNSAMNSSACGSSIIGAVGNMFLTLKVEQVWQKSNLSSADGRDTCYRRQASLTLVSLASASTYKSMQAPSSKPKDLLPSFDDSVITYSLAKFIDADVNNGGKISANKLEEDSGTQEKLQKQLNGALKALSSLSRIVQIRRNMESNESTDSNANGSSNASSGSSRKVGGRKANNDKNIPIATSGGPSTSSVSVRSSTQVASQHIPYRDSILTRLLQSSLEGNCFLFVLLYIKPKSTSSSSMNSIIDSLIGENTYRMVQFASEISSIHNTIWANDAIIPQYGTTVKTDDTPKVESINDRSIHPSDSGSTTTKDLLSKPVERGQGYALIQNALRLLSEDLRLWDIEQLDCIKNLGKEIVPTKAVKIYRNNERYSNYAVLKEAPGLDNGGKDYGDTVTSGLDSMGNDIQDESPSGQVGSVTVQADACGGEAAFISEALYSPDGVVSSSADSSKGTYSGSRVAGRSSSSAKTSSFGSGAAATSPVASSRKGVSSSSRSGIGTGSSKESPNSNSKLGSMKRVPTTDSSHSTGVQSAQFISKRSDSLMDSNGHNDSSNVEEIDSSSFVDPSESPSSAPRTSAVAMKILRGATPSTRRVQVLPPLVKTPKGSPSIGSSSAKLAQPSRSKQSKTQNSSNGNDSGIRVEVSPGSNDGSNNTNSITTAKSPQGGGGGGLSLLPSIDASMLQSPRRASKITPQSAGADLNRNSPPSSSSKGIARGASSLSSFSERVDPDSLRHEEPEDDVEQTVTAKEGKQARPKDEGVGIEESEDHLTEEERHFLHCVARGFLDLVEDCILAGVDITVKNRFNRDALQIATRNGYFPILKRLYKAHGGRQGGGLQQVMSTRSIENGDSLVHIAARYGHLEILRWFKDIGFPFNVVNHKGRTPVHAAAERAQLAVIQYLYNVHGQNLNFAAEDEDGMNPLDCIPMRADMVEASTIQHCREFISDIYVYVYG